MKRLISLMLLTLLATSGWSLERLFCGFEQAELSTWPVGIYSSIGDANNIGYYGLNTAPNAVWISSHDAANASQGEWALRHEIYPNSVPSNMNIRQGTDVYQNWNWISNGGSGYDQVWDSTRAYYGEYNGDAEWNINRFCGLFTLLRTLPQLPDSLRNWSAFDYAYIDVKSTAADAYFWIYVFGKDRWTEPRVFHVPAGNTYSTLRLPIKDMAWAGNLDFSDVRNFRIVLRETKGVTTIFIDNIRLVTADVAPALSVINDTRPIIPRLLTSWHKPPVAAPPAPPVGLSRVTGQVAASAPVSVGLPVLSALDGEGDRIENWVYGVAAFDNNRIAVVNNSFRNYVYSATPPEPNANPGGWHAGRGWIGTADGGVTWQSDATAGAYPLLFSTTGRGSYSSWHTGDNMLRGILYANPMGWCGNNDPGSGFQMYHFFYKAIPQNDHWDVYPEHKERTLPQRWDDIVTLDEVRGCAMGATALTALPNGRLWMASVSNHTNPAISYKAMFASYSDDGGNRWRFVQGNKSGVYPQGSSEAKSGSPNRLVNYHGKVMLITGGDILEYALGDENGWTAFSQFYNTNWNYIFKSTVAYKDSVVFALFSHYANPGGATLLKWQNNSAGTMMEVSPAAEGGSEPLMTLVGQRVWILWMNKAEKSYYRKIYFINSNTWSATEKIYQSTTDTLQYFEVPPVSPPSYVPFLFREGCNTTGRVQTKFMRIPITAAEEALDTDYDGLDDSQEAAYGCTVGNADSDNDGLWDGQEVCATNTNPHNADSDTDGDNDGVELQNYTNPKSATSKISTNAAPIASLVPVINGTAVTLDASATTDAESDALRYYWDVKDGSGVCYFVEGQRIVLSTGLIGARLTVDDGRGNRDIETYGTPPDSSQLSISAGANLGHALSLASYPNPFSGATTFAYHVAVTGGVTLKIFSVNGQLVKSFDNGVRTPGAYQFVWKTGKLPAGIYFARLQSGNKTMIKKLILMR
ncbi:MAG: T9SS type A sorting domain-containing protein [Fibrobacterota bacterium]